MQEFGVSYIVANLGLALFVFGCESCDLFLLGAVG